MFLGAMRYNILEAHNSKLEEVMTDYSLSLNLYGSNVYVS